MNPAPGKPSVSFEPGEHSNLEALARRVVELLREQPAPALVDAEAAAGMLSVPKSWLLAEARAGRVPHHRLGKYVRFSPGELTAWIVGTGNGPVPPSASTPVPAGLSNVGRASGTSPGTTSGVRRAA